MAHADNSVICPCCIANAIEGKLTGWRAKYQQGTGKTCGGRRVLSKLLQNHINLSVDQCIVDEVEAKLQSAKTHEDRIHDLNVIFFSAHGNDILDAYYNTRAYIKIHLPILAKLGAALPIQPNADQKHTLAEHDVGAHQQQYIPTASTLKHILLMECACCSETKECDFKRSTHYTIYDSIATGHGHRLDAQIKHYGQIRRRIAQEQIGDYMRHEGRKVSLDHFHAYVDALVRVLSKPPQFKVEIYDAAVHAATSLSKLTSHEKKQVLLHAWGIMAPVAPIATKQERDHFIQSATALYHKVRGARTTRVVPDVDTVDASDDEDSNETGSETEVDEQAHEEPFNDIFTASDADDQLVPGETDIETESVISVEGLEHGNKPADDSLSESEFEHVESETDTASIIAATEQSHASDTEEEDEPDNRSEANNSDTE